MAPFSFEASVDPIRPDLVEAYRRAWNHIAGPGTWLTGAERVAVADETRRARDCALCRERKEALSPFAVEGDHDHGGGLSEPLVDAVHRVTTDAARLSERWVRGLLEQGTTIERYVETLGVTVLVISIDRFCHAMGLPEEPLPQALSGTPTEEPAQDLVEGEAWVPMQSKERVARALGLPMGQAPYVVRALSLVPAEVEAWQSLSAAQYLSIERMRSFDSPRAIDRSQIELVAGRVSALNECFY